eukprot:5938184-Alexandrium_andersonii.AAC.1
MRAHAGQWASGRAGRLRTHCKFGRACGGRARSALEPILRPKADAVSALAMAILHLGSGVGRRA